VPKVFLVFLVRKVQEAILDSVVETVSQESMVNQAILVKLDQMDSLEKKVSPVPKDNLVKLLKDRKGRKVKKEPKVSKVKLV